MTSVTGRLCAVEGCVSSKRRNKELSFFHLPVDEERRKIWTDLIGRPDLSSPGKRVDSFFVCSLHFEPSAITYIPKLVPNALPTKLLPFESTTDVPETKEISTQTNYSSVKKLSKIHIKTEPVETVDDLPSESPRKRKHENESIPECNKIEIELDLVKQEII